MKQYKARDGKQRIKYTMVIPLKKNHLTKRAQTYAPLALKYGNKYNIDPSLILAVMECESEFNPYADNGLAYGLMQIVPKSGGYDAAKTAFGKKMYIQPYKLKKPEVNVNLGTALMYQSYNYKAYFKNYASFPVKQDLMVIAGYNCGAPKVARWIKNRPPYLKLSRNSFFKKLYIFVPAETKNYIKKVPARRKKYKTVTEK
ncbi:MAG TPA: transglycosylase SLT domain-containing protein [Spirochaetota bacterium]|nr:transglycosylase SLT domain-containing protein [Spirochaetota bacterium]